MIVIINGVKKIPDSDVEFKQVFRDLCEAYADEDDSDVRNHKARTNLLYFCKAYAYRVNGIVDW